MEGVEYSTTGLDEARMGLRRKEKKPIIPGGKEMIPAAFYFPGFLQEQPRTACVCTRGFWSDAS
jgi:hypothetical protein